MYISKFNRDLAYGQKFENLTAQYLDGERIKSIHFAKGMCPQFDYKVTYVDESTEYYEVKTNRMAARSGLFFIEYASKYNMASGLNITTADYYFLCVPSEDEQSIKELYKVPVPILKEAHTHQDKYIFLAPPQASTYGFLLPLNELLQYKIA